MKMLPGQVKNAEWGPLDCPFCSKRISDSVAQLGQQVTCPECHSTFNVKDTRNPNFAQTAIGVVCLLFLIAVVFFFLYPIIHSLIWLG